MLLLLTFLFFSVTVPASGNETVLTPYLEVRKEYDDNIFYSSEDEIDDTLTVFSPGIDLQKRSERFGASASAVFEWREYSENPELDGMDSGYHASLQNRFTDRFSLSFETDYTLDSRRDRDFEETGMVDDPDNLVPERVIRERTHWGTSADYTLSEITTAVFSYGFEKSEYDDPEFADASSHNADIGLNRDISRIIPLTTASINFNYYRYQSTDYPYFDTDLRKNDKEDLTLNSYATSAGLTTSLNETLDIMAHLGARYTEFRSVVTFLDEESPESHDDEWGTIGAVKLAYRGESTRWNLSVAHDIRPRSRTGETVNNTASVFRLSHRFTEKLRFGISTGYYLNRSTGAFSSEEIDEYAIRLRPELFFDLTKDISIEGYYSFRSVTDKTNDTETARNLAMIRLSYRFPL